MGFWSRLVAALSGRSETPPAGLPPRRVRRAAGKVRRRQTGEPHWTEADRYPRPRRRRELDDIAGLGMGNAGTRSVEDRS